MKDKRIESWLNDTGVSFEYVDGIALSDVDFDRSLANQARVGPAANSFQVEVYKASIKDDPFPPVTMRYASNGKLITIDGNHRLLAAKDAGLSKYHHGAYIVTCQESQAELLTKTANDCNGLALTEDDRLYHAARMVLGHGMLQKDAVKQFKVSESRLGNIVNAERAAERANRLGGSIATLGKTARLPLNTIQSDNLFLQVATVANDTEMKGEEVAALVKKVTAAPSEAAAEQIIKSARKEAEVVRRNTVGKRTKAHAVSAAISRVTRAVIALRPGDMAVLKGDLRDNAVAKLEVAKARIAEMLRH